MELGEEKDGGGVCVGSGANFPKYNWLIKTDINGNLLWHKSFTINGIKSIGVDNIVQSTDGNYFILANSYQYNQSDPIVMKLNPCGEIEWLKMFYTPSNPNDWCMFITLSPDGGCTLLINSELDDWSGMVNRLKLVHLSSTGDLVWSNYLLNDDSLAMGSEINSLIMLPDSGYLLSGYIYYTSSTSSSAWLHCYFIRTNSQGQMIWQKIVNKGSDNGGIALQSIIDSVNGNIYCMLNKTTAMPNTRSAGFLKLNSAGDTIASYYVVKDTAGTLYDGVWAYNASIISSGTLDVGGPWEYSYIFKTDTFGNRIKWRQVVEDLYPSYIKKTFDGKILYMTNTSTITSPPDFDCLIFKFNQNLESDTLYTQPFAYDYLCPQVIVNDTIWCNNPVIVGEEELMPDHNNNLHIFPNPARDRIQITLPNYNITNTKGQVFNSTYIQYHQTNDKDGIIEIIDIYGRKIMTQKTFADTNSVELDISAIKPGIYLIRYLVNSKVLGLGKFIIY